jgi:hypothetical protein
MARVDSRPGARTVESPESFARELETLRTGDLRPFAHWPDPTVPRLAAGVYTIWRGEELVYVGMSGRGLSAEAISEHRAAAARGLGLYSRLNSHASGRRSGDQFCIYVCDRLVLPTLTEDDLRRVAAGEESLDGWTRRYIADHLAYRFVEVADGQTAAGLESLVRAGALGVGKPLLNPLPTP